jgi:hypothetical protein
MEESLKKILFRDLDEKTWCLLPPNINLFSFALLWSLASSSTAYTPI